MSFCTHPKVLCGCPAPRDRLPRPVDGRRGAAGSESRLWCALRAGHRLVCRWWRDELAAALRLVLASPRIRGEAPGWPWCRPPPLLLDQHTVVMVRLVHDHRAKPTAALGKTAVATTTGTRGTIVAITASSVFSPADSRNGRKKIKKIYYLGLISNVDLKIILHDDLHGLISVGSGEPRSQSGN